MEIKVDINIRKLTLLFIIIALLSSAIVNARLDIDTDSVDYTSGSDFIISSDGNISIQAAHSLNITSDVNITGTLYGGSPVKIAGINITDNLFSHRENLNSSLRFTLQNLNSSMNASAVISAINDVNNSMSLGIGSSGFCLDAVPYYNVTALISRSKGKTVFVNSFNQSYIWFYNPLDDNNLANIVELMRLDENGLNLSANFTGNQFYAEMWFHNDTAGVLTTIASANVWYNISFSPSESSGQKLNGFTYDESSGTGVFTCHVAGLYSVDYKVSSGHAGGGAEEYQWEINVSGVGQDNTDAHRMIATGGDVGSASGGGFIDLIIGDTVYLQVTNRDGTRDLTVHALNVNLIRIGD